MVSVRLKVPITILEDLYIHVRRAEVFSKTFPLLPFSSFPFDTHLDGYPNAQGRLACLGKKIRANKAVQSSTVY